MRKTEFDLATGINPDPFCPVRLSPLTHNGSVTELLMTELQLPDSDLFVPACGQRGVHSKNYQLITNKQVHNLAESVIDKSGLKFEPVPSFSSGHSKPISWDGRRFVERWYTHDIQQGTRNGSAMMLGLEVMNSYDGSCRASIAFFAMHCACSNQFHSGKLLGKPFVCPHLVSGNIEQDLDYMLQGVQLTAGEFIRATAQLDTLNDHHVESFDEFLALRTACKEQTGLDFREKALLDELSGRGVTHELGIEVGKAYGDPSSYWAIANAYTAITTHEVGGQRSSEQTDRMLDFLLKRMGQ